MPRIDVVVETPVSRSIRARQVEAAFDVPPSERQKMEWHGDLQIGDDWKVGLIVGPSGSGKTTIARSLYPDYLDVPLSWGSESVIDDFDESYSVEDITRVCQAVGFNTIPAWLRPYAVLSNGEQFRAGLARRLLEGGDLIVVDEFTSVVDRQVAKIGAHAAQKFIRRHPTKRFIAVTCHYDVIDWLQPDWILEPHTMAVQRREVQRRPKLDIEIVRADRSVWRRFSRFHYLTADVHKGARFLVTLVAGEPVACNAILFRPSAGKAKNIWASSRIVCLPDWQGLGLGLMLSETTGAALKALGYRYRSYPAHPALIRVRMKSKAFKMIKRPGVMANRGTGQYVTHSRPCATFEYCGPAMDRKRAKTMLHDIQPFNARRWVR